MKKLIFSLFLLTAYALSGCQSNSGGGSGGDDSPTPQYGSLTCNVSFPSGLKSINYDGGINFNALGTVSDVTRVTIQGVRSSDSSTLIPETEMTKIAEGIWEFTVDNLPLNVLMKLRVNAYNSESVKIFTGWNETQITVPGPGLNEITIALTSIDDNTEPPNPVILSASIPSSIQKGTSGNILMFNIQHTGLFEYDVTTDIGTLAYDSTTDGGPSITTLIYHYTAPDVTGDGTVTIHVNYPASSDTVGTSYPLHIVFQSSTSGFNVLFGPVATGMVFFRHPSSLDVEVLADGTGDLSYAWVGNGDFNEFTGTTAQATISPFTNSSEGAVTATITDSQSITTSLTRTITLGMFNSSLWDSAPPTLSDTGQTHCYDATGDIMTCPAGGEAMAQDGSYPRNPRSFTDNGDETITDHNTKLMWQKEDDDTHMPSIGTVSSYCTDLRVGGYSDWRVPTLKELRTLVDYSKSNPTIDSVYFPGTDYDATRYWTTTYVGTYLAMIDFATGKEITSSASGYTTSLTRCVRSRYGSHPDIWSFDFTDVSSDANFAAESGQENVVRHGSTGLLWQKEPTATAITWLQALATCENLSDELNYWHLPNINELLSIEDYSQASGARMDSTYFGGNSGSRYWSSTTRNDTSSDAWAVVPATGSISFYSKDVAVALVRCVKTE